MAHGIKHGTEWSSPKIWGNELEKDGAAWTATKWYFPMLSLIAEREVSIGLHKLNVADNLRLGESKCGFALALRDGLGDSQNVLVERATARTEIMSDG
jgi:hypothetical protein